MRINRPILETMLHDNPVFKTIDPDLKFELLQAIDSHTYNLDLVIENRLALNILRYLQRMQKLNLDPYFQDLVYFLQLVATLNKRKEVMQSDLYMLRKLDLPIENWAKAVRNSVGKMMFREYYLYLDQNGSFKDQLTIDFYNKTISAYQMDLAHEIIKWLDASIIELEQSEEQPTTNEQLINRFYQQEIMIFYHEQLERILQIMKFQLRAFKLLEGY